MRFPRVLRATPIFIGRMGWGAPRGGCHGDHTLPGPLGRAPPLPSRDGEPWDKQGRPFWLLEDAGGRPAPPTLNPCLFLIGLRRPQPPR